MRILVMGVAGAGKTALGQALARTLACPFIDADGLHPHENIARMAAGIALDDAARAPWLDRVAGALADAADVVVACSALKLAYRNRLRQAAPDLRLLFLDMPPALLEARLASREGHFMPASLLASQLTTLEPPGPAEAPIIISPAPLSEQTARAHAALKG